MEKYIPLDAVLAEIEGLLDKGKYHEEYDCAYRDGNNGALYALKGKVNSLEVKEVDLEKELGILDNAYFEFNGVMVKGTTIVEELKVIAKHFFKLGVTVSNKAQKGEKAC